MIFNEKVHQDLFNLVFRELVEDADVYPFARITSDGRAVERTEWENGWNAALDMVLKYRGHIAGWLEQWTMLQQIDLKYLLEEGYFYPQMRDIGDASYAERHKEPKWKLELMLSLNDVFVYAADDQVVPPNQVSLLVKIVTDMGLGYHGALAWAAHVRSETPLDEKICLTREYVTAKNMIVEHERHEAALARALSNEN